MCEILNISQENCYQEYFNILRENGAIMDRHVYDENGLQSKNEHAKNYMKGKIPGCIHGYYFTNYINTKRALEELEAIYILNKLVGEESIG